MSASSIPWFQNAVPRRLLASSRILILFGLTVLAFLLMQSRAEGQLHQEYIIWSAPLWSANYSPQFVSSPALAQDGTVYVTAQSIDKTTHFQAQAIIAFQPSPPAGGSVFISFMNSGQYDGINSSPMIADDGSVYVGNNARFLYAYSPAFLYPPLQQKWTQGPANINGNVYSTPAFRSGVLYIGEDDACAGCQALVRAFDINGNPKWQYFLANPGNGDLDCSLSITAAGKLVCIGEHNNLITALTPGNSSATLFWSAAVPTDITQNGGVQSGYQFNASPAVDSDGTIYIGGSSGLTAISPNGVVLWTFVPRPEYYLKSVQSSPVIGTNHSLYFGGEDGLLYALKTTDGSLKWTFSPQDWQGLNLQAITSTPATALQGIVYVTMWNPNDNTPVLFAVRDLGTTVQELWRVQLTGYYTSTSPMIGWDGTVYVADYANLYAIQSPTHLYNAPANTSWPMYQHDQRHTGFAGTPQMLGCCAIADLPEAWWRFQDNTLDSSGNSHNGTLTGSYSWIARQLGDADALNVTANLSGMTVPDSLNLNFTAGQNITVEGWIKPENFNTASGIMEIVDKRIVSGSNAKGYALYLLNGKLMFQLGLSTSTPPTSFGPFGSDLRNGAWHHVAITVNRGSTSGGQVYIDGVPSGSFDPTALNSDLTTTAPLLVGLSSDNSIDGNFRGGLDEICVWRRVLNPSEIYSIFASSYVGKCSY